MGTPGVRVDAAQVNGSQRGSVEVGGKPVGAVGGGEREDTNAGTQGGLDAGGGVLDDQRGVRKGAEPMRRSVYLLRADGRDPSPSERAFIQTLCSCCSASVAGCTT